ncbi:MAG: lipid-A-disaccharide synthase [Longimicrobiales bacterium]
MAAPRILISAGEPSGDLHGAGVARALREQWPDAELYGFGGTLMRNAGVTLRAHVDDLAVMGFAEVARHLPFFLRLLRETKRDLDAAPPDLVIPIDYPGFNMRLARMAKERSIPVLYYIAPQVWAWHRSRVQTLADSSDRLAVILPFEQRIFEDAGTRAAFVGHPLLDLRDEPTSRAALCAQLGIDPVRPILALFPGSRAQEVKRHLELFQAAADRVRVARPDVQPVIAAGDAVPEALYASSRFPRTPDNRALLAHAAAALVKSGTTTLQAAVAGTPLVIAYRMHPLSYVIARRVVEVEHVGLVNLVAGERLAPEFIQDDATPEALAAALLPLLDDGDVRTRTLEGLARVRESLQPPPGAGDAATQVAALARELVEA